MMCFTLGCNNGDDNNDDTDTGDSRRTSDESFFKDLCDTDTEDDCFQLREDITVFNPDDFSDVTDFRVIHIDEVQATEQLKDGDVVVEMILKDGAPLPEPVEVGRVLYRKKGNQITVRRIKGVQQDGNRARFLTENLALKDVFKRWRMTGRWGIDFESQSATKLGPNEEPGDRVNKTFDCSPTKVIDDINDALPEGVTAGATCNLTFDLVAEVRNIGGFVTENGVSKIGVVGSAQFYADASLTTNARLTEKDGTVAKMIDFNQSDPLANRISIPLGPITLKLGAKFKIVASSSTANTVFTNVSARIEAGPVVTKDAKKGFEFTFFEKRVTDDPTGGDFKCDGVGVEDNPCFWYNPPYLLRDGEMNLKVGIEPEILITSPAIAGLAGITLGMYTFGEFNIEGEVDQTQVEDVAASGFVAGINLEQVACWELNVGFTPTIGVEVLGNEIVEFNVATFRQPIWGECGESELTVGGDDVDWCQSVETLAIGDVSPGEVIDTLLGPVFGEGICLVDRHCTFLEQPDRPDKLCMPENPTCNKETCICEEPEPLKAPDFVGSVKIRDAWMRDADSYCCLPQEAIKEQKEAGGALGPVYWNSFSCNDSDFSTVDTCVDGRCQYEFLPGTCLDESHCDPSEVWVAEDDADRDLGMAPAVVDLTVGSCFGEFSPGDVDKELIEKRWPDSGGNFLLIDDNYGDVARARFDADIRSPLWDDKGKLGQKDELGVCSWDSDRGGVTPPPTASLDCNVNNQHVDCDDGLPFTFDYCSPDEDILSYNWLSPEAAPRKWGRCYHGIQECPLEIVPLLDAGTITREAMKPCCEQLVGKKLKANESWMISTIEDRPAPADTGAYDWTCNRVSLSISTSPDWSPDED
jgi:hypothetical protein